jgi:hypothetical protein
MGACHLNRSALAFLNFASDDPPAERIGHYREATLADNI